MGKVSHTIGTRVRRTFGWNFAKHTDDLVLSVPVLLVVATPRSPPPPPPRNETQRNPAPREKMECEAVDLDVEDKPGSHRSGMFRDWVASGSGWFQLKHCYTFRRLWICYDGSKYTSCSHSVGLAVISFEGVRVASRGW